MRTLYIIARLLIGSVFIFSGFVKGVDPFGSTYKFLDYFAAFGLNFFDFLALPMAFTLSVAEFLIGVSVLMGWKHRTGVWTALVFTGFFTILSFYLALTNPVTDCGCFGDALIMTNWQTFFKNTLLLPLVLFIFFYRNKFSPRYGSFTEWSLLAGFAILFLVLETFCFQHLPVLDFRPYKTGTYIPDGMSVPEGAAQDEYRTYLYYEKDGVTEEFTEDNFPWEDTTWTFVDSKHDLVSKGYEAPIHDFNIVDAEGYEITDMVLSDDNFSFLLISHDLAKADMDALFLANDLALNCLSGNCSFYCMTSSSQDDIDRVISEINPVFEFYLTDEITLKTIIRSNPGLLLLKGGVILEKWHLNDFPELGVPDQAFLGEIISGQKLSADRITVFFLVSLFISLVILVYFILPPNEQKT